MRIKHFFEDVLSILYLRCRPLPQLHLHRQWDDFQFSIWDAHRGLGAAAGPGRTFLSILYLRCGGAASTWGSSFRGSTFNSLFEMQEIPPFPIPQYAWLVFQFSIWDARWCRRSRRRRLGGRWCFQFSIWDATNAHMPYPPFSYPFNSLFEMPDTKGWA
mgnify:CR=1 FL=1